MLRTAEQTEGCVLDEIRIGYWSIDTDQAYGNEAGVGNACVPTAEDRKGIYEKKRRTESLFFSHYDLQTVEWFMVYDSGLNVIRMSSGRRLTNG